MKKKKFSFLLGTRPEVIKLAPVIREAIARGHRVQTILTGQHRHLALPLLEFFGLKADMELGVMRPGQGLSELSARVLQEMDRHRDVIASDCVVTQGDTTSAFVASYWAFCHRLPVAHVEAGLRTYQLDNPFPEEANRQLIGRLANFHFAPTALAVNALKKENVPAERIFRVGNTSIDALKFTLAQLKNPESIPASERLPAKIGRLIEGKKIVLLTAHRRESFGEPLRNVFRAVRTLADMENGCFFVYPVHPNPNVRKAAEEVLAGHSRILLIEPQAYVAFVSLMRASSLILTDSGGVQEEAPTLRKPILVLRETSERPEGIKRGFAKLVGTDPTLIVKEARKSLRSSKSGKGGNPYGDGRSSQRIVSILERSL